MARYRLSQVRQPKHKGGDLVAYTFLSPTESLHPQCILCSRMRQKEEITISQRSNHFTMRSVCNRDVYTHVEHNLSFLGPHSSGARIYLKHFGGTDGCRVALRAVALLATK